MAFHPKFRENGQFFVYYTSARKEPHTSVISRFRVSPDDRGTFDAAFDAWYVYAYFHRENEPDFGLAAVPFSEKGGYKAKQRRFDAQGWPLCQAEIGRAHV